MLSFRTPAILLVTLLAPSLAFAQGSFNQIAITGESAPGTTDGAEFDFFNSPTVSASGDVAFQAFLQGEMVGFANNNLVANFGPTSGTGSLGLIARQGESASEVIDGTTFGFLGAPELNASGDVAFTAPLEGAVNTTAILGPTSDSSLGLIARTGDPAPGVDGGTFSSFSNLMLNASGDVAFTGLLSGVASTNNSGIFGPTSGVDPSLGLIVREDDVAPGVGDGAEFSNFSALSVNASGDVAFRAFLRTGTGAVVDGNNSVAIFGPTSGSSLDLIAREGDAAPGAGDGVLFDTFSTVSLNASGDVAFTGALRGDDVDSANNAVLFALFNDEFELLAREGDLVPGLDGGIEFNSFNSLAFNASGDVVFTGSLRGDGVDNTNDGALFTLIDGVLEVVVREGDLFTVTLPDAASTEERTINSINFSSTGFSDAGTLAFGLVFDDVTGGTNTTDGLFTTTVSAVPEPGMGLLALASLPLLARRRRSAGH